MNVLSGWKEIAQYLNRGVRTVQRWEQTSHLPVHRVTGAPRGSVFALTDELDKWASTTPVRGEGIAQLEAKVAELISENTLLRGKLSESESLIEFLKRELQFSRSGPRSKARHPGAATETPKLVGTVPLAEKPRSRAS